MSFSMLKLGLDSLDELDCDTLVAYHFAEERPLKGLAGFVDWRMKGWLSKQVLHGHASGRPRETLLTPGKRQFPVSRLMMVGLGVRTEFTPDVYRAVCLSTLRALIRLPSRSFALEIPGGDRHHLVPRQAMEMWLTAYHQTVVSLGMHVDVTFVGTGAEIEDWRDPVTRFEKQYGGELGAF